MKKNKAEATHNAIVDAARDLFNEKSVKKVTVSDITKRAGVAKGTFYVHFESKDELVWHFIDHEIGLIFGWFDTIMDFGYEDDEIIRFVDFIVCYVKKKEKSLRLIHDIRFFSFLGKQQMEKKFFDDMVHPIVAWLTKGKNEGQLKVEDTRFLGYYITISFHEMLDRIICKDIPFTFDELGENMKHLLLRILK